MHVKYGASILFAALSASTARGGYEVWLTDQNNTAGFSASAPRGTHGGRLLIYDGADVRANPEIIDLAEMFATGSANNTTGAAVVRPHMIQPSPDHRHVALAFVASGHVAIFDGATRRPVALFRTTAGAGGARQAHAAMWTLDGRSLIVANQNGKLLEKIVYDPARDRFEHDPGSTVDLANCRTPNGHPCQSATPLDDRDPAYAGPHNRPDTAPICPIPTVDGKVMVTLRGGGLFVVDPAARPMAIVGEYGNASMGRDGCGGVQHGKSVFLNGGAGTLETNPAHFMLFEARDEFPSAPGFLPANAERWLRFVDGNAGPERDGHGMTLTAGGHFLWHFDRLANVADIYRIPGGKYVNTVDLTASGSSPDPTPDIAVLSPQGDRIYVALRGPKPQTGAHASAGTTPGLGVVSISGGGSGGRLEMVLRTRFVNPVDGSEESDPHGVCVRLK